MVVSVSVLIGVGISMPLEDHHDEMSSSGDLVKGSRKPEWENVQVEGVRSLDSRPGVIVGEVKQIPLGTTRAQFKKKCQQ